MIYKTQLPSYGTCIMWSDPSIKGNQKVNYSSNQDLKEGDYVEVGEMEKTSYYLIKKVEEKRYANISGFNYFETISERVNKTEL